MEEYKKSYKDLTRLLNITPKLAVCDLHPNYYSSRFTQSLMLPMMKVQHHHAHIASVMAEHGLKGPVIGVAFDGTGYGTDGSIWGGEFLICEGTEFVRAAHLSPFPILGGDQSMQDGKKTAVCYLHHAGLDSSFPDERKQLITAALDQRINTVLTSSMGRLFDAAASVLQIAHENRYEGECAILLEREAEIARREHIKPPSLPFLITKEEGVLKLDPRPFFEAAVNCKDRTKTGALALGFHHAAAEGIAEICEMLRGCYHTSDVALSGGVFQNTVLTELTITLLKKRGFHVYVNRLVPPGDGGLSLGQIYLGREHWKKATRNWKKGENLMCVAIPGKIIEIRGDYARVNVMDNITDVNIKLVDAGIGDYVLIHAGCAIEVISGEMAEDILSLFSELQEDRYEDPGSD